MFQFLTSSQVCYAVYSDNVKLTPFCVASFCDHTHNKTWWHARNKRVVDTMFCASAAVSLWMILSYCKDFQCWVCGGSDCLTGLTCFLTKFLIQCLDASQRHCMNIVLQHCIHACGVSAQVDRACLRELALGWNVGWMIDIGSQITLWQGYVSFGSLLFFIEDRMQHQKQLSHAISPCAIVLLIIWPVGYTHAVMRMQNITWLTQAEKCFYQPLHIWPYHWDT